jgi:DNA polymerase (family 10)
MRLQIAESVASTIVKLLEPYCERIQVAGSIRRCKPECHDIDIVLIPKDHWNLNIALKKIGTQKKSGEKISQFITAGGHQVDIYFATEETWATLLLIRTGSKESNIRLCSEAKKRGWKLCATGNGLFNELGERIAGDSEASIFNKLGMAYIEPERRD